MPQVNERVVDFLVLPIVEGIVEVIQPEEHAVVKAILEERVSERIVEQIVFEGSVLVPPTREKIVSVVQFSKHVMVPPIKQAIADPQEHIQERTVEQSVDTPVPPDKEENRGSCADHAK